MKIGTPEEVSAAYERAFRKLQRPKRQKRFKSAQEVLDEVRKALGTPEGECIIEHAKKLALRNHG